MDLSHILEPLNQVQKTAVVLEAKYCLIVAGAGSGKTLILVHRIAWLIETGRAASPEILAVTFTNKAATQMRSRTEHMLRGPIEDMWVGTFHGMAHRMLRQNWQKTGFQKNFQLLDNDEQLRCIRKVLENMSLNEDRWPSRQIQSYINTRKDKGVRPQHIEKGADYWSDKMIDVYTKYQAYCDNASLVDFSELLLRCFELLRDNDELLAQYQQRFKHLLVDEFQDTNTIQYAWIRLLTGDALSLFAVGDDDQAIYGWRGAQLENMMKFTSDFANTVTVRLEQNYRSTKTILHVANELISHNQGRMGKKLWANGPRGEPITVYKAINDLDEAHFIICQLKDWLTHGGSLGQCAILYRISSQSRVLEEVLLDARITYLIQGGQRFYERLEIKNTLDYLRLIMQSDDNVAFERIVNFPVRGIGMRTINTIQKVANEQEISMWDAAKIIIEQRQVVLRSCKALADFMELIESLKACIQGLALAAQVRCVLEKSELFKYYKKEKSEAAQTRLDNLEELISAANQFEINYFDAPDQLAAFLSHTVLDTSRNLIEPKQQAIKLMTIHASKGLEFDMVFICGLEEGLLPHSRSSDNINKIEEERRLCYVGITRAKKKLILTYAEVRHLNSSDYYPSPSRFLSDLPIEQLDIRSRDSVAPTKTISVESVPTKKYYQSKEPNSHKPFHLGQIVAHPRFGKGVVLVYQDAGDDARIQVKFDSVGCKWLLQSYAKLSPLEVIVAS